MSRALDRWNPLTALAASMLLVAVAYAGPQPWSPLLALAAALTVARATNVGARVRRLAVVVAVPTFCLLVLMNGVIAPVGRPVRLGPVRFAPAALRGAAELSLRLAAAVAALGWIAAAVPPRRLLQSLAQRGLPSWSAYLVVASLAAVSEARRRAQDVMDAQRCRGLAVRTGVWGRLASLAPLAGPLLVSLVTESEERALALDARGFRAGARRTSMTPVTDRPAEGAIRALLWLSVAAVLVWGMTH